MTVAKGLSSGGRNATPVRARDLGIAFGTGRPGTLNSITDVQGVRVGHATIHDDEWDIHSGVTALTHEVLGSGGTLAAGFFVGNGFGKFVGATQIDELGSIETPVLLTSTLSTFRVADSMITWLKKRSTSTITSINPVVGEVNDSWLTPDADRPVGRDQVFAALDGARDGLVSMGNVGGGAGACALGFKAGIGTSSRMVSVRGQEGTVGVLVQANMTGILRIAGQTLSPHAIGLPVSGPMTSSGSCVVVVALDFPATARDLHRIARRGVFGLARVGAGYSHGSGDYALSLSTVDEAADTLSAADIDGVFDAVLDSVEEAVIESLVAARTVRLSNGRTAFALPHAAVAAGVRS